MEVIFILLLGLILMTLVGHGIWALIAWLLRGGRGRRETARYEPTLSDDRAATARYLEHLRSQGAIDGEVHGQLMRLMAEDVMPASLVAANRARRTVREDAVRSRVSPQSSADIELQPPPLAAPVPLSAATPEAKTSTEPWRSSSAVALAEAVAQPPPSAPRRPLNEVLFRFMAEKNIRWGELVGGILILCCSAALVVSLWSQIEAIPVLKFLIFTAVTAGLFGAGLFVHHRWKLPTTGHAVLILSTLLVPLNMLAFAAFSGPMVPGVWSLAAEVLAVLLFGWLTLHAGRILLPDAPWLFAGGVAALSASSLVIRLFSPHTDGQVLGMALLPTAIYAAVMAVAGRRCWRADEMGEEDARRLFLQLGVFTFAALVPLGLLLYQAGSVGTVLHLLGPLSCLVPVPALVTGLLIWRRLGASAPVSLRTVALTVALLAVGLMVLGVGLSWPTPWRLMAALLVNALAMAGLIRIVRHPLFHGAAAVWLAAAWVLGLHLIGGGLAWTASEPGDVAATLLSARTGQALVVAVVACLLLAAWLDRRQRHVLSICYVALGGSFLAISVALVTWFGFALPGDARHVAWVYAVYAIAAFLVAGRLRSPLLVWLGAVLGQMAISQTLVYLWPAPYPAWPTALLAGASLSTAGVMLVRRLSTRWATTESYIDPLTQFATVASLAAVVWLACLLPAVTLPALAVQLAWLSGLWLVLAFLGRWPVMFAGSQVALVIAACTGAHQYMQGLAWYQVSASPIREPWIWQVHLLVAGGLCLVWAIVRAVINRRHPPVLPASEMAGTPASEPKSRSGVASGLLNPVFPPADRLITALVLLGLVILSAWGVSAGLLTEHGGQATSSLFHQHRHAAEAGSWVVLLVAVATLGVSLVNRLRAWPILGVLVAIECGVALVAARFDDRQEVVNALRWLSAAVFLAGSVAAWLRSYWLDGLGRLARGGTGNLPRLFGDGYPVLFSLYALPALVLTATLAFSAGRVSALPLATASDWDLRLVLLGPVAIVTLGLIGFAIRESQPTYAGAASVLACAAATGTELCILGRTGSTVSLVFAVWLVQLNIIISSAVALLWHLIRGLSTRREDTLVFPTWLLVVGRSVLLAVLLLSVGALWLDPLRVPAFIGAVGKVWGLLAALLVEVAWFINGRSPRRLAVARGIGAWTFIVGVLTACALLPFDTGNWLCFHALLVSLVAAGWVRLCGGAWVARQLVGPGWTETFNAAAMRAGGCATEIAYDVTCSGCGYNLRGLSPAGRCPECNAEVAASLQAAISRLTPAWTGELAQVRVRTSAVVLTGALLCGLSAVPAVFGDPQRPWWSVGALTAAGALCMALGGWAPKRAFAYLGGAAACLAASGWWLVKQGFGWASVPVMDVGTLTNINVVALALAGLAWLLVERRLVLPRVAVSSAGRWPVFHHAAGALSVGVVAAVAGVQMYGVAAQGSAPGAMLISWLAWAAAALLMFACCVRPVLRHAPVGLYVLGSAGVALVAVQCSTEARTLAWAMSLGLAAYVLIAALIWRLLSRTHRDALAQLEIGSWLPGASDLLTTASLLLSGYVSFANPELAKRLLVVMAPSLCAASLLIAPPAKRPVNRQTCFLLLLAAAAVLFAWSWMLPGAATGLLQRAIGLIIVGSLIVFASMIATRRGVANPDWMSAISRCVLVVCAVAGAALLYCSAIEITALINGLAVSLAGWMSGAFLGSLVLLIVCGLWMAARECCDPLHVSPSGRQAYVYLAEVLAGLIGLHVRATMPWLFTGVIIQYWTILVVGLAMALSAVGETCQYRGLPVLGRPFGRTGAVLPLLTLLELFLASARIHYSIVLLAAGVLYAVRAGLRRSVSFSVLAAASLSGSLWYFLYQTNGLGLTRHPQLWFVPPALAVLVAGHVTRATLRETHRRAINYGCLLAVYLSSTADILLIGVAQAPWLPLVLAGLSVAGILVGIAARVRSFLMLGSGFLGLALLTMIWHAATNLGWTWVWYVAGIALGAGIITLFALLEKKRREMSAWFEELKRWPE